MIVRMEHHDLNEIYQSLQNARRALEQAQQEDTDLLNHPLIDAAILSVNYATEELKSGVTRHQDMHFT